MIFPKNVPDLGFYYHYKHRVESGVNHHAYEVVGTGVHTEEDCRPEDSSMVVYRPLYESEVFTNGKFFDLRPLEMWMGQVTHEGSEIPRFQRIIDQGILENLREIRNKMYGVNL